jgi:drug/metabolite transporter (DMT)-like permease
VSRQNAKGLSVSRVKLRGIALISAGTLCLSTVPVFSKLVMADMSSVHFSFFWMCFGLSYTIVFSVAKGPQASITSLRREWKYLIAAGVSAFVWVILAFAGIKRLDPTVSIVFFNIRGVWGVLIGLAFLKERYVAWQYVGMAIIIAGVALNLVGTEGTDEVVGSLITIGSALAYAVTNGLVKRFVTRSGIVPALFARFTIPAIALFFLGVGSGIPFEALQGRTLLILTFGSFVGPFLSFVLIYSSLKYLDLGVQSFFQSAGLFFTAIFSYFVFASVPTPIQITGGLIVVTGMIVMSVARTPAVRIASST